MLKSNSAKSQLLIDRHTLNHNLTYNNLPVFPVPDEDIYNCLQELAGLVNCGLKEVIGQPGKLRTGKEEVVGLGQLADSSSQLYAHLTQRRLKLIEDISLLTEIPSVLITTADKLNAGLMNALYSSNDRKDAPGIICGISSKDLFKQCIIRAAATFLNNFVISGNSIELYPTSSLSEKQVLGRTIFGGQADSSRVRKALRRGAELITVLSHGDGVDALLHPKLVLCSMRDPIKTSNPKKSPYCLETGFCFRHNKNVADVINTNRLLSPKEIRARILNLCVCHGVLCPDGEIDPQWGYLHQFLESNTLGALVTSWSVISASPKMLKPFFDSIYGGKTVGYSTAQLNNSALAKESNVRFCLFGDPSIKIQNKSTEVVLPKTSIRSTSKNKEIQTDFDEITFLRLYLTNALLKCSGQLSILAQTALNLVNFYESAAIQGYKVEGDDNSVGSRMRLSILEFLYARGTVISHDWINLIKSKKSAPGNSCFNCGMQTETTICEFRLSQIVPRRLQICPRCSIIEDVPVTSNLTLSIKNKGMIFLKGKLPSVDWTAGLRLGCQNDAESHGYRWTNGRNNTPSRQFKTLTRWPRGPLKVAFIILQKSSISIISIPGRWNPEWDNRF